MIKTIFFKPVVWISLFSVILFSSCAKQAFHKAIDKNTVKSYNKFLKKHGDSKYAAKAKVLKTDIKKKNKPYKKPVSVKKADKKKPISKKVKKTNNTTGKIKAGKADNLILKAEKNATKAGRNILAEGRKMALVDKVILPGSCWNWINTVYKNAGHPNNGKRKTVFKSKKSGPYVKSSQIEPGDWLYYINHSYNNVEHSGIFVHWVDYKKKIGMILSYGGESRKQPGRYKPYDLTHVYNIIRAVSE